MCALEGEIQARNCLYLSLHFDTLDALVALAPPNLDPDVGPFGPKGGDVLPCFEGVFLPWSRFIGGHPSYCRLAVRQDGDQSESVVSCCRYLQGPRTRRHRLPGPSPCGSCGPSNLAVFPDDDVSGCSVLRTGPVCKDRQPWSVGPLSLARLIRFLCYYVKSS